MKRALCSAVAVVALVAESAIAQSSPAPHSKAAASATNKALSEVEQRRQIIFNLMDEAHAAAEELPTEQRVAILKTICGTAYASAQPWRLPPAGRARVKSSDSKVNSAEVTDPQTRKQVRDWSEELYAAADQLQQGSYTRLEAQIAAVRAMVPADNKRALQMLDGLDASDEQAAQQQRNFLAMYVYSERVRTEGESAGPDLRARAQALGESGHYPYSAMANVAAEIQSKELVRSIFNDALSNFQHSDDKLNSMYGILVFLRRDDVRAKLHPWQLHEGALAITNRLKAEIDKERSAYNEGRPMRPGLSLIVNGIETGLKEVDPELASTVPELPPYKPSPAKQTVGDDAPAAAKEPPELKKLRTEFDKTSTRLMEMSEDEVHSGPELRQVIEKGIDQAVEVLRGSTQDAKDHVTTLDSSMGPVTDFVQVGARTNPAMTLAAVRKVQDSEIRARMLLVIAEGLPVPE